MEAQYSKMTIAQLRQKLVEKGVKMPSKAKKKDLVTRLIKAESKGSMSGIVVLDTDPKSKLWLDLVVWLQLCHSQSFKLPLTPPPTRQMF